MTCYVIGEKTPENRIEKKIECLTEYLGFLQAVCKEVKQLKKERCQHFVFCSDCEFVDDFYDAVIHFFDFTPTIKFRRALPDNIKEDDTIILIRDGMLFRKSS